MQVHKTSMADPDFEQNQKEKEKEKEREIVK